MPNGSALAERLPEALVGRDNTAALAIATEHLRQGRLDAAHSVLRGVLEHSPSDLGAVNGLAAEAAARGDAARAQALLEAALASDSGHAPSLANLAGLHLAAGRLAEARLCLERAEHLPGGPNLAGLRAQLFAAEGDTAGALAILQRLADQAPGEAEHRYNLAVLLFGQGQLAEAEEALRAAISLAPAMREAWHNLGMVLLRRGRAEEGIGCLRHALMLAPGDPMTAASLADALLDAGRPLEAEAEARRCLVVVPEAPMPSLSLARALSAQGRGTEALALIARVVRALPDHPLPLLALADAFALTGQPARAMASAQQAVQRAPAEPSITLSAVDILLRGGDFTAAWALLDKLAPEAEAGVIALDDDAIEILRFARLLPAARAVFGAGPFTPLLAVNGIALVDAPPPMGAQPPIMLARQARTLGGEAPLRPDPARVAAWARALEGRPRPVIAIACGDEAAGEPALPDILAALGAGGTRLGLLADGARARIEEAPEMLDGGEWVYRPEEVAAAMLAADAVVTGDGYLGHLAGALRCRRLAVLAPPMGDWCWGMPGTAAPWYPGATICRATLAPQGLDWRPALAALAIAAKNWAED